jgi:hypothetical protein
MSSDEGLRIGGRGRQINSKVKIDKKGEYDCIIETKLGLQAKSQDVFRQLLLAPYIGG